MHSTFEQDGLNTSLSLIKLQTVFFLRISPDLCSQNTYVRKFAIVNVFSDPLRCKSSLNNLELISLKCNHQVRQCPYFPVSAGWQEPNLVSVNQQTQLNHIVQLSLQCPQVLFHQLTTALGNSLTFCYCALDFNLPF